MISSFVVVSCISQLFQTCKTYFFIFEENMHILAYVIFGSNELVTTKQLSSWYEYWVTVTGWLAGREKHLRDTCVTQHLLTYLFFTVWSTCYHCRPRRVSLHTRSAPRTQVAWPSTGSCFILRLSTQTMDIYLFSTSIYYFYLVLIHQTNVKL